MEQLQGIPETMLITIWAKAIEKKQPKPIIVDNKAEEILKKLDYDFTKFANSKLSQIGVVIRTEIIDKALTSFLEHHGESIIINIGAGLDTRYARVADTRIAHWYDIDVPEAIDLRRKFIPETSKVTFIAKSVFDYTWFDLIEETDLPIMLICEGMLMYFTEDELKPLFSQLATHFPQSELIFDIIPAAMVKHSKHHDSVSKIKNPDGKGVEFKWGIKNPREITNWDRRIDFKNFWSYYDYHKERWTWFRLLSKIPLIRKIIRCGLIQISFN